MNATTDNVPLLGSGPYHPGARPMETVQDANGDWWLCDKGVDPHSGLEQQGCWQCGEHAFTRQ